MNTTTKIDQKNLRKKLIKSRIRISCWNGNVRSDKGQAELANIHGAETEDINAGVSLLPKDVQKTLRDHVVGLRDLVITHSLPYQDGGVRIMPAADFPELHREVQNRVAKYRNYVMDEIYGKYDQLKEMASTRLNGLFDESRFPDQESIMTKYGATLLAEPLPDLEDIRLTGVSETDLQTIREETSKEFEEAISRGQKEMLANLAKAVENILNKTEGEKSRYGKAVENLKELCESAKRLNILENPEIDRMADKIEKTLGKITTDSMKEKGVNKKVKVEAKTLLDEIGKIKF